MTTTAETAMARRKTWFGLMQTSHAEETSHAQQGMRTVIFTLPEHIFDALWAESIATESSLGILMAERLADSLRGDDLLCTCGVCGRPIKDGEPRSQDFEVGTVCDACAYEPATASTYNDARAALLGKVTPSEAAPQPMEWREFPPEDCPRCGSKVEVQVPAARAQNYFHAADPVRCSEGCGCAMSIAIYGPEEACLEHEE